MSRYTTQLRWYIETLTKGQNLTPEQRIAAARPKVFDFVYPIWDEKDRVEFETNFIRKFYMCEICCETIALWKMFLHEWLVENMPYYNAKMNAIIYSQDFKAILDNVDYIETSKFTETNAGSGNTTVDTNTQDNGNRTDKYYEVPLKNISDITSHLNNLTNSESENNQHGTSNSDFTDERNIGRNNNLTKKGKIGVNKVDYLNKYLESLLNVRKEIYNDMASLFIGIY